MLINPVKGEENCVYVISEEEKIHKNMGMDVKILKLKKDEEYKIRYLTKECAVLLIQGEVQWSFENKKRESKRGCCFNDYPELLHICRGKEVKIIALEDSELVIQAAENPLEFETKFYERGDCKDTVIDMKVLEGTAKRVVRDIINYDIAPYSNLVIGEVITYPGKWSSYPPHSHDQPEVYYYKFTKPQGFGAAFIGDDVYKITHNSASIIDGGKVHPQVVAPGYGMYYCWMIRHLENNPWTKRVDEECHKWIYEKNEIL